MQPDGGTPEGDEGEVGTVAVNLSEWLRATASHWRVPLQLAAAAVFIIGLGVSISALDLSLDQLRVWPIVVNFTALAPSTLALAAVSLQLSAKAVGRRIRFREAFAVSAVGRITELLPLPGAAMVRGAALMRAGAGLAASTWIVTLAGVLTLSMAAALAAVPIVTTGFGSGYVVLVAGVAGTVGAAFWIVRRAGAPLALTMIVVRLGIIAIAIGRVSAAFAGINAALDPLEAALFVICATLGTATVVVPGGLGVSESIAAALAYLVQISPAVAFLAIATNRIIGLVASGVVAFTLGPNLLKSRAN